MDWIQRHDLNEGGKEVRGFARDAKEVVAVRFESNGAQQKQGESGSLGTTQKRKGEVMAARS